MMTQPNFAALTGRALTEFLIETSKRQHVSAAAAGSGNAVPSDFEQLIAGCGFADDGDSIDPFGCFFPLDEG
jgi:hypothetical protein